MESVVCPVWTEKTWRLFRRYENRAEVANNLWQQYLGASSVIGANADSHWQRYRRAAEAQRRAFESFLQAKDGVQ